MIDLDDAAYQNAEAARDAAADFADESACWSDAEWQAYEAEMRAEWERERMIDERDAWDARVPLAEFDDCPF